MREGTAKRAIEELLILGKNVDSLILLTDEIENEKEKSEFRKHIGEILAESVEMIDFVVKQYPHLDPFKELFAEWDRLEGKIKD